MISVKGLSVSYDKKLVLSNVYVDFPKGALCGILGPNGAGKSTLFKAILGLTPINAGKILIDDKPISEQRKNVVYVPQKGDVDWQFPATVYDVVLMGRYPHRRFFERLTKHDHEWAMEALKSLGMEGLKDRQIGELSGGQQQRVFLARAVCQQADFLLLDEPFVGVDITTEEKIVELLKILISEGKTILVVHHDLSKVQAYFQQVLLLNQRVVACGDTATTFTDANIERAYGGQLTILHNTHGLR